MYKMGILNIHGFMYYVIFLSMRLGKVLLVETSEFYPYKDSTVLKESFVHIDLSISYPHWADQSNIKIDIVNSGIVRFSGLDGLNTLDLLVLANSLPFEMKGQEDLNIFYKTFSPSDHLKTKFKNDLSNTKLTNVKDFNVKHMTICTWVDVQFYSDGSTSSFQIVLGSDGNRTFAIVLVAKMNIPSTILTFYPEMDLRFAYAGGTKFLRTGYINETGVSTATRATNIVAVDQSNSNVKGRWILDLNSVNITEEAAAPTIPPSIPISEFENSTNIGLSGEFVFNELSLDNSVLTRPGNNDEISVILAKKDSDTRYLKLNNNIRAWVTEVYKKASNDSGATVEILGYKAGSLVVEYSVKIPNVKLVCADTSRAECLQKVSTDVKTVSANEPVKTADMSGNIDETRTVITDFDECTSTSGQYCDRNAYCINFPGELTYGCKCKDGFDGNGFPGNCKKPKESVIKKNLGIIAGSAGAGGVVIIIILGIVCYVKQKEKTNFEFRRAAMQRTLPQRLLPEDARKKKTRSTRRMLIPAAYSGRDFDIYHRTSTS